MLTLKKLVELYPFINKTDLWKNLFFSNEDTDGLGDEEDYDVEEFDIDERNVPPEKLDTIEDYFRFIVSMNYWGCSVKNFSCEIRENFEEKLVEIINFSCDKKQVNS